MVFCLFYFLIGLHSADGEDINNLTSKCLAAVSSLGTDSLLKDFGRFVLGSKSFEIFGQSQGRVRKRRVCVGGESWCSASMGPVVCPEKEKKGLLRLFCLRLSAR